MKRTALIFALVLTGAVQAHASKARLSALQRAEFLVDSQTIFENPAHVNALGRYLTFEFGGAANSSTPKAEGGIFAQEMGGNMGLYLGHVSPNQRSLRAVSGYENQNNPIEFFYGKNNWGMSLSLSNYDNRNTGVKEQSAGVRFGMENDGTEFYASVEAFSTAEVGGSAKYTGAPYVNLGMEKAVDTAYYVAKAKWGMTNQDLTASPYTNRKVDDMGVEIGALSRRYKNIYYGAYLSYDERKIESNKTTVWSIPLVAGVEADLNSWSVVRASVTQGLLLGTTKDEVATPGAKEIIDANDTRVAAGMGFKYNGFTLDGVVSGSANGNLNGNDVLSQASVTYNF